MIGALGYIYTLCIFFWDFVLICFYFCFFVYYIFFLFNDCLFIIIIILFYSFCFFVFFRFCLGMFWIFLELFFLFFPFQLVFPFYFFVFSRFFFELLGVFLFGGFEFLFELLDWFFFVMWFLFFLNFPDFCGILIFFFERIATLRSSPALLGVAQGSLMKMYHPPSFDMTLWRPEDVTKDETFKSQAVEKTCRHHRYHQTSWEFLRWDRIEIW